MKQQLIEKIKAEIIRSKKSIECDVLYDYEKGYERGKLIFCNWILSELENNNCDNCLLFSMAKCVGRRIDENHEEYQIDYCSDFQAKKGK
jgi:hypothetical protein